MSKIEVLSPQGNVQEGQRLVIIELERYTGSQGHVCYQDGGQRVSVTMAAVHMGVEEMGMQTGKRGTYNWPLSWE